jgi:hypothetical protein
LGNLRGGCYTCFSVKIRINGAQLGYRMDGDCARMATTRKNSCNNHQKQQEEIFLNQSSQSWNPLQKNKWRVTAAWQLLCATVTGVSDSLLPMYILSIIFINDIGNR